MIVVVITAVVIILDQVTKILVRQNLVVNRDSVPVIDDFFHLTHVANDGMAFGINFEGGIYIFTAASILMTIFLFFYLWNVRNSSLLLRSALALILGGAIGNLIDRVLFKEVTDFFHFIFGNYDWYIFNIADSAVTIGMILFLIYTIFLEPKENSEPA